MRGRKALLLSFLSFLIPFFLYLKTLCPTLYWGDSGELVTASWSLGIPHPHGFPIWCLLTHPFTWLPIGDAAYRVNMASAFFSALSSLAVFVLVYRETRSPWAMAAPLALAASFSFWDDATVSEVYSLTFLFFSLVLVFTWYWLERHSLAHLRWASLCAALGVASHYLFLLAVPVWFFLVLSRRGPHSFARVLTTVAVSFLAGLAVFLYLPIRAHANPALNWGDPDTWGRFWDHVTRAQYQAKGVAISGFALPVSEVEYSVTQLVLQMFIHPFRLLRMCLAEFGWPLFFLGLWGFCALWRKHLIWAAYLATTFLFAGEVYGFFDRFALPADTGNHRPYAFLFIIFSLWIGSGSARLVDLARHVPRLTSHVPRLTSHVPRPSSYATWLRFPVLAPVLVGLMCALLLPVHLVWAHFERHDRSDAVFARDLAERTLKSLPKSSVLLVNNDYLYFSCMYLREVEGMRRDVSLIVRSRLDQNIYPEQVARAYPHLDIPRGEELRRLMELNRDPQQTGEFRRPRFNAMWTGVCINRNMGKVPIFWEIGKEVIEGFTLIPHGTVAEITRPIYADEWDQRVAGFHDDFWRRYREEMLSRPAFRKDAAGRDALSLLLNNMALAYLGRGRLDDAAQWVEQAIELSPNYPEPYGILGDISFERGVLDKARGYFHQALAIKDIAGPHLGLGKIYHAERRLEEAEREYMKALELIPNFPEAELKLAQLRFEQGRFEEAEALRRAAQRRMEALGRRPPQQR